MYQRAQTAIIFFLKMRSRRVPVIFCSCLFAYACSHRVHDTASTHTKGAVKSWGPLHTSYNIIEELSDGCSRGGKYRASSSMFRLLLPKRDFPTAVELCLALLDAMLINLT